jgi:transcriptional regulator with XRE-family HTH domain
MAVVTNNLRVLVEQKQNKIQEQTGKRPTQTDIASAMGIASSTLSAYMMGKRDNISLKSWQSMVDYFGVPGHEIFDLKPNSQ